MTGGAGNSNALVGTPETVAQAILDYIDLGVDIISMRGYDLLQDAVDVGQQVIPIVRDGGRQARRGPGPLMPARPLHFNAFIWPNGYHESAWRLADDDVRGVLGLPYYAEIARTAERGLMDSVFLADNIAIPEYRVTHLPQTQFDPVAVLSALAGTTSRIGLIGTGSTTYSKPWDLARRFATLDHLSGGRAGWNIVTTSTPLVAANFGEASHPEHADRYARADEFVDVVRRAWDSWEDDAVVGDREGGVWGEPGQAARAALPRQVLRRRRHLAVPPLTAGMAGARAGRAVPGRYRPGGPLRRAGLLRAALAGGRGRLPGRAAPAGRRRRARPRSAARPARAHDHPGRDRGRGPGPGRELDELASPEFRWQNLLYMTGHDPDGFAPDAPLPAELYDGRPLPVSRARPLYDAAREHPGLPLRELARRLSRARPRISSRAPRSSSPTT